MSQMMVDTEEIEDVAQALRGYAEAVLAHFDQVAEAWRSLPEHWQGRAAEQAHEDLRRWLNQVEESSNMARVLGQRLLEAKQSLEQADLEGLKSV
jgi:WXG100 family type VII secretion target